MKISASNKIRIFKFISESVIRKDYIDLSPWQFLELRAKLPKSIYWVQPSERGKLHWNIDLLQDYLINGDRPEHKTLVEEFIATLPKTA